MLFRPAALWTIQGSDNGRLEIGACLGVKDIGKPCAGKPHARFDEGGQPAAALYSTLCWKPCRVGTVFCAHAGRSFPFRHLVITGHRPIRRIDPIAHISMKRRIRPIRRTFRIPMFHRIEMDVIGMPDEIIFMANLMFPESPLPDC